MQRSIVELISLEESAQAITFVEKTLAKKLLGVIANQRSTVARDTYGSLGECYGADESPEFMEPADNAYQVFYMNALKKFGVNGPQDFQDINSRDQFFNYLDQNWRAQDTVQQQQVPGVGMQGAPGGTNIDLGTQTQLPAQATQPQPPQGQAQPNNPNQQGLPQQPQPVQMPNQKMPMGGSEDPSVATMAPTGPSIDKTAPMGPDGDDSELDGLQNTQAQDGRDGFNPAMGGADQFGNGPDDDQDPDLEIGDDDSDQNGFGNDDDEMDLSGDNEDQSDEQVPNSSEFGDDDQQDGDNDNDEDDPFGEDDAYTVDPSDFSRGDDDDQDGEFENDDSDDSNDQNGDDSVYIHGRRYVPADDDQVGGFDDDSDDDDQGDDDDSDPDLEIGNDDDDSDNKHPDKHQGDSDKKPASKPTSDDSDQSDDDKTKKPFPPKKKPFGESMKPSDRSRKTRKNDSAKATRLAGKKESKLREGEDGEIDDDATFGEEYAADNAADAAFLEERMNFYQATKKQLKTDKSIPPDQRRQRLGSVDGDLKMSVRKAQRDLNIVAAARDQSHQHWRKIRADVKNNQNKSTQEKKAALHQISQLAKKDLEHFRMKADAIKGIHTGKAGGDAGWHGHSQGMHEEVSLVEMVQHTVTHPSGRTKVHITANQAEGPFSSRMYVNNGETATNTSAKHKTLTGAKKWANVAMKKHHGE